MNRTVFTLFSMIFLGFSCKTPTPVVADCAPGLLPCEDDITACCEVVCPEFYHNCGDMLTNCCIDTTSHQFSFAVDSLGIYGSYLNDVAIVDENDIWVVGNIRMPDPDSTNGTGYQNFNAAHYDGSEWELIKIQPQGYVIPIQCINYFNENDIWFGQGGLPIQWNGIEYYLYTPANGEHPGQPSIDSIWGTSSSDMYFVGQNGSIVHYDGSSFVQMESGTDVDLKDIAGTQDGEHVFAVGRDHISTAPSVALEFENGNWNTLYYTEGTQPHDGNLGWIYGVDVLEDTVYFSTTNSLWKYNYMTDQSVLVPNSTGHFGEGAFKRINIHSINDVFYGGAGFKYIHFNGVDYHYSHEITDMYAQRAMHGTDYNGQLAVMVGYCCSYGHGLVVRVYHE